MHSRLALAVLSVLIGYFQTSSSQRINDPLSPFKRRGDAYLASSREDEQKVLSFIGDGSDDMEVAIVNNVLRRAKIKTFISGIKYPKTMTVKMKFNMSILPDIELLRTEVAQPFDVIVLPGGPGYREVIQSQIAMTLVKEQDNARRFIVAMSVAQLTLLFHKIALGRNITVHPEYTAFFYKDFVVQDKRLVHDGHLITSRGPADSIEVGLFIVELLRGSEFANSLAANLTYERQHHVEYW